MGFLKNNKTKPKKKKFLGQHFLRNHNVVTDMLSSVKITSKDTVMEIGPGDGFLTSAILEQTKCKNLIAFEIDKEWYQFLKKRIKDKRLKLQQQDILKLDWAKLKSYIPLIMLSNLPYQITFPILFKLQEHREFFKEGTIMIQEEVAQKLVATKGRNYSATTLFLQNYFKFKLLTKIGPENFSPPPKVQSRLVHFIPIKNPQSIPKEKKFWKFLKLLFKYPRRTILNNIKQTSYDSSKIPIKILQKRAQELTIQDFKKIWKFFVN